MTRSSWSFGPPPRTRVIGSGLSIEGTLELPRHDLDGPVDVRHARGFQGLCLRAPLRKDRVPLLADHGVRVPQDRGRALVRLAAQAVLQFEGLAPGFPHNPVALRLRGPL